MLLFFREEYKDLSAVVTCDNWFQFGEGFEKLMSEDIITYFNHNANHKIKFEEIKFGKRKMMFCSEDKCKLREV